MKMYKVTVRMVTVCYKADFVIPCVTSSKAAIELVMLLENCPRRCLSVLSCEELETEPEDKGTVIKVTK